MTMDETTAARVAQIEQERDTALAQAQSQRERAEALGAQLAKDVAYWAERASLAEQAKESLERNLAAQDAAYQQHLTNGGK